VSELDDEEDCGRPNKLRSTVTVADVSVKGPGLSEKRDKRGDVFLRSRSRSGDGLDRDEAEALPLPGGK